MTKIFSHDFSISFANFRFCEKIPKYFLSTFVKIFFISKYFSEKIFFHLYKSEISPGFQKSHLENQRGPLSLPSMVFDYFFPKSLQTITRILLTSHNPLISTLGLIRISCTCTNLKDLHSKLFGMFAICDVILVFTRERACKKQLFLGKEP